MHPLHPDKIKELELKANAIRQSIIEMLVAAGSGHTAGPLGMADVFTAFYFYILDHDPSNPNWAGRDRLILSNGHIVPVRYAAMAHAGYFPVEELLTLRKFGSRLQGHPERLRLPGLETTSGPLGSGLGQACGIAYGARMDASARSAQVKWRTYCFLSDAEHQEGNHWESVMFAGKNKLANLTALVDRNYIQIDGSTEEVMPLESLAKKYEAFNWQVLEINGHDFSEIVGAVERTREEVSRPTVIIAHTIPGKGVSEIEFNYTWHGMVPKPEEAKKFLSELRTLRGKINNDE